MGDLPGLKSEKPKVLVLGSPLAYVDRRYLEDFERDYDVQVFDARNRAETIEKLGQKVEQDGPFEAFVCKMGTDAYEAYDAALLSPLAKDCRIIASASAGYNEFDVRWMTAHGIWFTNTVDAVSEATADMAVLLILATVRNFSLAEKRARAGEWKTGFTPTDDTYGKTLGVLGGVEYWEAGRAEGEGVRV